MSLDASRKQCHTRGVFFQLRAIRLVEVCVGRSRLLDTVTLFLFSFFAACTLYVWSHHTLDRYFVGASYRCEFCGKIDVHNARKIVHQLFGQRCIVTKGFPTLFNRITSDMVHRRIDVTV